MGTSSLQPIERVQKWQGVRVMEKEEQKQPDRPCDLSGCVEGSVVYATGPRVVY